ncbi:MAG TPA: inorganic phosphate transporter [Actinopolymorphaceae bacterium]
MTWALAFGIVAVLFVFVCGANDGATLLGLGLRFPQTSGIFTLVALLVCLVAVPLLFGVAVADTFTERLADFATTQGAAAFLVGVAVSLAVVAVLAWQGLPTSLTLALIGGIAGAGLGAGLEVTWSEVGRVLAIGAVTPVIGGGLAYLLGMASRRIPTWLGMQRGRRVAHLVAYTAQCVAYAANDGQKMIAVAAVAITVGRERGIGDVGPVTVSVGMLVVVAVVFGIGALGSLFRVGERLGRGLVLTRPLHVVSTETAAASAVLASAGLGVPVSMSQSIAAGVVGVAATEGHRRIRWQNVVNIVAAWVFTLPSSLGVGALAGLGVRLL